MKKIYLLIGFLLLLFLIFLIVVFVPKNYKVNYKVNNINIYEEYRKHDKNYLLNINYNKLDYPLIIEKKYSRKRKIVENIKVYEEENEICLEILVNGEKYYACSDNNELKMINLMSSKMLEKLSYSSNDSNNIITNYKNIKIYNIDYKYLVWDYKGFIKIGAKNAELKMFDKDNYKNYLSYQAGPYLVFPDYDSEYYFYKLYIYNAERDTLSNIVFDFEIYYDTYYLGDLNNKVYLFDRKNKVEYEIDLVRNDLLIVSNEETGIYYHNSVWEKVSLNKLANNDVKFTYDYKYNFLEDQNKLYIEINGKKIQISNKNITKIINISNDTVFYLSNNKVYKYKYLDKEVLLLENDEWNFNYNNHIFVFD